MFEERIFAFLRHRLPIGKPNHDLFTFSLITQEKRNFSQKINGCWRRFITKVHRKTQKYKFYTFCGGFSWYLNCQKPTAEFEKHPFYTPPRCPNSTLYTRNLSFFSSKNSLSDPAAIFQATTLRSIAENNSVTLTLHLFSLNSEIFRTFYEK